MAQLKSIKVFRNNELLHKIKHCICDLDISRENYTLIIKSKDEESPIIINLKSPKTIDLLSKKLILNDKFCVVFIKFSSLKEKNEFISKNKQLKFESHSNFDERTDPSSATAYFLFYSYLAQQQNMLCDRVRTETYRLAILKNQIDFKDKIVLDVGTGSGVLAFFAVFAGAKKVYAIEASSIAKHARELVNCNLLEDKIVVINSKIEDIDIPMVDTIISEPMGYMLFNERMLESYIHSRKFLSPNGRMYPSIADWYAVPFTDLNLYTEVFNKGLFWSQKCFYGINLTPCCEDAHIENFSQPVVDSFDPSIFIAFPQCERFDFTTLEESDLFVIEKNFLFKITTNAVLNGFAFWFTVGFHGSQNIVYLSTSPDRQLTHWYQLRLLFLSPINVMTGNSVLFTIKMIANSKQSYDIETCAHIIDSGEKTYGKYDLKNCYFRFFNPSNQIPQPPNVLIESEPVPKYNEINDYNNQYQDF